MTEAQFAKYEKLRDQLAHKHFQTKRTQNIADVLETIFDELLRRLELKPKVKKARKDVPSEASTSAEGKGFSAGDKEFEVSEVTNGDRSISSASEVQTRRDSKLSENSEFEALLQAEYRRSTFDLSRDIPDEDLALRNFTSDSEVRTGTNGPSASEVNWHSLTPKRKKIILEKHSCCQFKNPATGRVCGSTFNLQVDHIHPKWDGGSNDPQNLRVLCRAHNQFRYELNR
jgi:5-methylcytosine-specific restriction endonuclease McrA